MWAASPKSNILLFNLSSYINIIIVPYFKQNISIVLEPFNIDMQSNKSSI